MDEIVPIPSVRYVTESIELEKIRNGIGSNNFYFQLRGGLGNQLFGLSEAHDIAKSLSLKALIDISYLEHRDTYDVPEWITYTKGWNWCEFVVNKTNDPIVSASSLIDIATLETHAKYMGRHFVGWRPNLENIKKSGLFQKGLFPFPLPETNGLQPGALAIHVRRGDYIGNRNLGLLKSEYYRRAYNTLSNDYRITSLHLFSDDILNSKLLIKKITSNIDVIDPNLTALQTLKVLSSATYIVGSNSTFTFWGSYFSTAKIVIPYPFYIADWNWDRQLWDSSVRLVRRGQILRIKRFIFNFHQILLRVRGKLVKYSAILEDIFQK
jgi:hypothetical protein